MEGVKTNTHTWDLRTSAEQRTQFFKWQGEKEDMWPQNKNVQPTTLFFCEIHNKREKTSCNCFSDSAVTSNNPSNFVIIIVILWFLLQWKF